MAQMVPNTIQLKVSSLLLDVSAFPMDKVCKTCLCIACNNFGIFSIFTKFHPKFTKFTLIEE